MTRTAEHTVNAQLARPLGGKHPCCRKRVDVNQAVLPGRVAEAARDSYVFADFTENAVPLGYCQQMLENLERLQ